MVTNLLGIILKELSKTALLPMVDLVPDRNNSCLIALPDGLKIQIEIDKTERNLLIGSLLGEIPLGPYRSDLFREALRANYAPWPRHGDLGYSTKTSNLILYELMPVEGISGELVAEHLKPFIDKAYIWVDAIKNGSLPPQNAIAHSSGLRSLFDLQK